MLGAVAEWLPSAVAGLALSPTSIGGQDLLFWPRIPDTFETTEIVKYASATQGTKHGDAAIAWRLLIGANSTKKVMIRALVPPGSTATLRLPVVPHTWRRIMSASILPDFDLAKSTAKTKCDLRRRKKKFGFPFHWEYDRISEMWHRVNRTKEIGTSCQSFLFQVSEDTIEWIDINDGVERTGDVSLQAGFYEVSIGNWKIRPDVEQIPGYTQYDGSMGSYCSDPSTFDWDPMDAEHLV